MEALGSHLQYVWASAIVYPSFADTIHTLRIKNYFKLALLFSKGAYQPLMERFWFKDLIGEMDTPVSRLLTLGSKELRRRRLDRFSY